MLLGTVTTVKVLICATILYVIISIIFGLMRISKNKFIQGIATVYIEFFRGTSLLVQLFWFYYVLPFFGISLEAFTAGVVSCILIYSVSVVFSCILIMSLKYPRMKLNSSIYCLYSDITLSRGCETPSTIILLVNDVIELVVAHASNIKFDPIKSVNAAHILFMF